MEAVNPPTDTPDSDDALAAGVEQFQRAALEALRAARSMLDAAESIVQDPKAIESVISSVAGLARDATSAVAGFATGASRSGSEPEADPDVDVGRGFETIDVD